ncbi:MAG: replication and repair protein RecF protein [Candidatus Daviesbacteria bacterium GW2011_GWA2_38_24]|uniref:DNA replication and repair protein RecF n=1 Tax=Candidatus Daviesbacteria bacterium GW2011_GWA2_38_24 TaxID=1618422 RepID=A0A0G0JDA4_9BACT|nr:MAG: replication and repair protein RecF protein [Candidatus Daviesbacteria bacterium GW2011_GWA2_38_24]KKQ80690.1 MAG: replication and repair protein RecF protein [Candidatus Daviesbacteria bacterium GW2011_GWA1_38_7]OGE24318.1 MAG: hypothetical protein A2688_00040 [Candidatus Daviesbacteria bacterium RIFCSPHIGHO2_01_FULL_38_8]
MYLKKLKLTNYRNYFDLDFEFVSPITMLIGNNAQGKSNFLESIYFLSTTKSLKAEKDEELVKEGENFVRAEGIVEENETEETNLEIGMQFVDGSMSKRVKINGLSKRVLDYIGNMPAVLFAPEDINLVTDSPSLRRWHVDMTLAQIDREYKVALTNYGEVVTRRNKVLKGIQEGIAKIDELTFWTDRLLEFGQTVTQKRKEFFEFINQTKEKFGNYRYEYQESLFNRERLQEYQSREIASATTLIGPHRDDFLFLLDSRDLSKYGSRGEIRTAVLDLKISEVDFIEQKKGKRPILLLDDVFSELDLTHREHVLDLCFKQQTIITAVELDDHLQVFFEENGQILEVKQGIVNLFSETEQTT